MDALDLRVFEAVARCGSMSSAAAELHTVQSNVTARVRQLEARLGMELFRRTPRGVELTPAGGRLLPFAQRMSSLLDDARRAVLDVGTPSGPLSIGSLETTLALRIAPVLADFASHYPAVDIGIRTGTTCELIAQVLDRRLDGAFICGPIAHGDLDSEEVCREELVLLSAPGTSALHLLANELDQVRIIVLRRGCSYRQRLEDLLVRKGVPMPRVLEFGTLEAIFASVSAGLGVTLLPRALIGNVVRPGRLAVEVLPAEEGSVETLFIRRRDGYLSSGLKAFVAYVRSSSEDPHRSAAA
jgi:LysR family transcriptional regulator, cell division regulator